MDELLAIADSLLFPDIVQEAPKPDLSLLLAKEKCENEKLKFMIASLHKSTQGISTLYQKEQKVCKELNKQIEDTKTLYSELLLRHKELENQNLNKIYYQDQLLAEFKEKPIEVKKDYEELGKEYLSLLSYLTVNNNFEIDTTRNRIILKTEKFLRKSYPDFKVKIIKSNGKGRRVKRSKENAPKPDTKRRRVVDESNDRIWENVASPNTISETSSMYSYESEVDDHFDDNSNFDFVEPKSSLKNLGLQQVLQVEEIREDQEIVQVKELQETGTQTDNNRPIILSDTCERSTNTELDLEPPRKLMELRTVETNTEPLHIEPPPKEVKTISTSTNTEETSPKIKTSSISTNTEPFDPPDSNKTVENTKKSTSYSDLVTNCDKSTATTISTVTRGTSSQDLEDQLTVQSILSETIFQVPSFVEPFINEILACKTVGTMTDLSNINKRISYMQIKEELIMLKTECVTPSSPVHNFSNNHLVPCLSFDQFYDNNKFITIGKIMFELFLDMIKPNVDVQNNYLESCSQLKDKFMESFLEVCQSDENACELFGRVTREDTSVCGNSYIESLPKDINLELEDCSSHEEEAISGLEPKNHTIGGILNDTISEILNDTISEILNDTICEELILPVEDNEILPVEEVKKSPAKVLPSKTLGPVKDDFFQVPALPSPLKKQQIFIKPLIVSSQKNEKISVTSVFAREAPLHRVNNQRKKKPKKKSQGKIIKGIRKYFELPPPLIPPIYDLPDLTKALKVSEPKNHFEHKVKDLFETIKLKITPTVTVPQVKEIDEQESSAETSKTTESLLPCFEEASPEIKQIAVNENTVEINTSILDKVNIEEIQETEVSHDFLELEEFESPQSPAEFFYEVDFEHEPVSIPLSSEDQEVIEIFSAPKNSKESEKIDDSPQSPLPEIPSMIYLEPKVIPLEDLTEFETRNGVTPIYEALNFDPKIRATILKTHKQILLKTDDKKLCKLRKSIKLFLDEEWSIESTELCINCLSKNPNVHVLSLAILETLDDHGLDEISFEFTPPAPPLPTYQQKLILLARKLEPLIPGLPIKILEGLEQRLFSWDVGQLDMDSLSNYSYFYAALVDLFLGGNYSILFHFIYKSIYFHGYKAIQMAFVILKSCPLTLPKKCYFLKGAETDLKYNEIDPLVLTVLQILTNTECCNNKMHESYAIRTHEMFKYMPRHYGFPLNFLNSGQILKLLVDHIQANRCTNVSFSLIILAKRSSFEFAHKNILKTSLIPLLKGFFAKSLVKGDEDKHTCQINLLIESITSIMKQMKNDQEKVSSEIFGLLGEILHRSSSKSVQESCIQGILRINRFNSNLKDIYHIIQQWNPTYKISEHTQLMIKTFVHRKEKAFFKV